MARAKTEPVPDEVATLYAVAEVDGKVEVQSVVGERNGLVWTLRESIAGFGWRTAIGVGVADKTPEAAVKRWRKATKEEIADHIEEARRLMALLNAELDLASANE